MEYTTFLKKQAQPVIDFPSMWRWIGIGALAGSAICSAAENQLSAEEKRAGFVLLFDGATMTGWVDPRESQPAGTAWTAEDGCLKATAKPKITEDLFTKRTFRDFELRWEWRISAKGNSGVKYRIQKHFFVLERLPGERFEATVGRSLDHPLASRPAKAQDYVAGFEYQMTDNQTNGDALSNLKHTAGALYDMEAPERDAAKPVGEWNQSRIVVRGKHVEHWLNGVKVVDADLDSAAVTGSIRTRWAPAPAMVRMLTEQPVKDCPISLQNHGDEAWFRDIRVRELR